MPLARASTADAILSQSESFPFPFEDFVCPSCINALLLALLENPLFKPFNGGDGRPSLGDFGIYEKVFLSFLPPENEVYDDGDPFVCRSLLDRLRISDELVCEIGRNVAPSGLDGL